MLVVMKVEYLVVRARISSSEGANSVHADTESQEISEEMMIHLILTFLVVNVHRVETVSHSAGSVDSCYHFIHCAAQVSEAAGLRQCLGCQRLICLGPESCFNNASNFKILPEVVVQFYCQC